jgi:hypothetical protein
VYGQYGDYKPYPVHGGGAPPPDMLDRLTGRLKEIVQNTNPMLLSALVVLVVGMAIFLILAFQFGWIKTGPAPKAAAPKDTIAPVISILGDQRTLQHAVGIRGLAVPQYNHAD